MQDFTVAINIDPSNPVIYANRGQVYKKMEMFEKALDDYASEIKYGTSNLVKAYNNRAYCNAKLGQYAEAVEDYTKVLELDTMNTHALHNRGISYQRMEEFDLV